MGIYIFINKIYFNKIEGIFIEIFGIQKSQWTLTNSSNPAPWLKPIKLLASWINKHRYKIECFKITAKRQSYNYFIIIIVINIIQLIPSKVGHWTWIAISLINRCGDMAVPKAAQVGWLCQCGPCRVMGLVWTGRDHTWATWGPH